MTTISLVDKDLKHSFASMDMQEFEDYHTFKFGKQPKLMRKLEKDEVSREDRVPSASTSNKSKLGKPRPTKLPPVQKTKSEVTLPMNESKSIAMVSQEEALTLQPNISSIKRMAGPGAFAGNAHPSKLEHGDSVDTLYDNKLLKPMPVLGEGMTGEYRELASIITRDIFVENPNVRWSDIAGLDSAKQLLKEAIVFPMKYPELFQGILKPWKGILLYGSPGTGKTLLAKAVATECKTTFFNISASSIVSKWRGDSEKLVRVLFELARYHAPSTIFLDELESIMSHRSSDGSEHEGSRRMKTELLIQMDGLAKTDAHVFLLAASNLPWDLDTAMLRRLEKRILIDLPDEKSREYMFRNALNADSYPHPMSLKDSDYAMMAKRTEGYSGADITLVCKEAAMRPLRNVFASFENGDMNGLKVRSLTMRDVLDAIECTNPTTSADQREHCNAWQQAHGSS